MVVFGAVALLWIIRGLSVAYGALRLPWLKDFPAAREVEYPAVSLIFAARDEEEKLRTALATLAALDYPNLEIIGVDDRSQDATGHILDEFARAHGRLRAIHVPTLPAGWLGKPHALYTAYEQSRGEWLLFTDADVRFAPDALRRAMSLVKQRKLDYLTLFADVEMDGFWEKVLMTFFGMAFYLALDPPRASNPRSSAYVGVGAFQLVKRSAYKAVGTHRRLAMEVVDDIKLGKIIKKAGFRCSAGISGESVLVRWHSGLGNLVRGVTKNFFASSGFSLPVVMASTIAVVLMNVAPFVALFTAHGWARVFAFVAVVIALGFHAGVNAVMRVSPLYAFTHPVGAVLFCYMLLRSTVVTLWQGGVTWRDTFYPLDKLKRGIV